MLKCVCKRYSKLLICVMVSLIISVNLCSLTYSEEVTPEAVSEANEVNVQAEAAVGIPPLCYWASNLRP